MDSETTNLFRRRDTFFGICEAVGQDFGFNPLWLRPAFIAPLFFFPVESIDAYFGLGIVVLGSRLLLPARRPDAAAALPTVAGHVHAAARAEMAHAACLPRPGPGDSRNSAEWGEGM